MNRQERRRLQRQGASEDYIEKKRKDSIYNEGYEQGHKDGMLKAIEITFYMVAYTLQYKLDMKDHQLSEVMYWIYNNIDAFRSGHLTSEDFDTIKKEIESMGVRLK